MPTSDMKPPVARVPVAALRGVSISKPVHPRRLLDELHQLGITGACQVTAEGAVLAIQTRPASVSDAQIQQIIAAHNASAPDPVQAQLAQWGSLPQAQRDALLVAAIKRI